MLDNVYTPGSFNGDGVANTNSMPWVRANVTESPFAQSPEQMLWLAFIQLKVDDARGIGIASHATCLACHFDQLDCGCYTQVIDPSWIKQKGDLVYLRIGNYTHRTSANSIAQFDDGKLYWRKLRKRCPNAHTLQACAKAWLASDDAQAFCEEHDLSIDYVRRMV